MFTFGVSYFLCLNFFVRCDLCVLVVRLFREMGKLDLRGGNGKLGEWEMGEREYRREGKQLCNGAIWQLLKWPLHFLIG